jgi:ribosome biogenesis GTPase / thiamine phosphate phosphatase
MESNVTLLSSSISHLIDLGFSSFFQNAFAPHGAVGLLPGRVALQHRGAYVLFVDDGELHAELAGRMRHEASGAEELPAVGDWVAFRPNPDGGRAIVHALLPRRTAFVRGAAGGTTEAQVVAANVDVALVVCALASDLNLRRLERYLATARASGADAAIVLTKADLSNAVIDQVADVERVAAGAPVHAVSSLTGAGLDGLGGYFTENRTVALLGSSGSGKSTLVNRLIGGSRQAVAPLGTDGRGQHTTTQRELVLLPGGGVVMDTPGMRELRLWEGGDALDETFSDVLALAAECRFRDCAHDGEPGCAVTGALEEGALDADRWESYRKLQREVSALAARKDARAAQDAKRRIKVLSRAIRARYHGR